jgi:succinate---hydroxymethylglutarate CoA-transferase
MSTDLLAGVRVVEVSQLIAASLCGLTLADYGAEVIKLEPVDGEYARTIEPFFPSGESAYFQMLNRGKRALAADYRAPGARAVLARLIASADIVVENLACSAAAVGLDRQEAMRANPDLIWCSISGRGDGVEGRAIDPTLQASMGMMALSGEQDRRPLRLPVPLVDFMTGIYAVQAVLAAVLAVRAGAGGAHLDCALIDAAATLTSSAGVYALGGPEPLRRIGTENHWYAPASNFQASDGRWIQLMTISEYHWRGLCRALGHRAWLDDPRMRDNEARVQHRHLVHRLIEETIATAPAAHWLEAITAEGAFCAPVNEIEEAWADPALAERGLLATVDGEDAFPVPVASLARTRTGGKLPRAPRLGEDSAEIAAGLGFSADEIARLLDDRALISTTA